MSVATFTYNPKVNNPKMSNNIPQMRSQGFQAPFYFGGSRVPIDLGMPNIARGSSVQQSPLLRQVALPHSIPFRK